MQNLTGKQVRYLRGLGHRLKPVVMIGRGDITPRVMAEIEENLESKELIKIRIQEGCSLDRKEVAAEIAEKTSGSIAQILGNTILLYRQSAEKIINLPSAKQQTP